MLSNSPLIRLDFKEARIVVNSTLWVVKREDNHVWWSPEDATIEYRAASKGRPPKHERILIWWHDNNLRSISIGLDTFRAIAVWLKAAGIDILSEDSNAQ